MMARDKEKVFRAKVTAAIVFKGKVVAYGYNQHRTSWLRRKFKKNEHSNYMCAEVDAIKNALKSISADDLKKSTIFVARAKTVNGKDVYGNAKPCKGCQMCIDWFELKNVYFTTDEGTVERI